MNKTTKLGEEFKINLIKYSFSLFAVLLIGSLLIMAQGENPITAVSSIFVGAFGSKVNFGNTLHWMAPCMLVGTAALIAFRSGVMNLGLEGQIYFGALAAGLAGYMVELPPIIHPLFCIVVGGIAGMLWALLPAILRLFFNISEVISTLILNYIAILLAELFTILLMKFEKNMSVTNIATTKILDSARLLVLIKGTNATSALIIAAVILVVVYLVYKYTVVGYELKQVGQNLKFAKIGGVNASRVFISIFLISGFIAGICGATETIGVNYKFISRFSANLGWDGVMITRVAANSPGGVAVVSFIWAAFKAGAMHMERNTVLNRYVINLLQAIFVLFISIDYKMLYTNYKERKFIKSQSLKERD
ncbi:MAG: ABC transporter permease [Ruminococcaceae bacterium]|nr:ABC transporter permease [Oscillospiraceae bacterium]